MHIDAPYLLVSAWTWMRNNDDEWLNDHLNPLIHWLFRDFQEVYCPSNAAYKTDSPDSFGYRGKRRQAIPAENTWKKTHSDFSSFIFAIFPLQMHDTLWDSIIGLNWRRCAQIYHGPTFSSTCPFQWGLDVSRSKIMHIVRLLNFTDLETRTVSICIVLQKTLHGNLRGL